MCYKTCCIEKLCEILARVETDAQKQGWPHHVNFAQGVAKKKFGDNLRSEELMVCFYFCLWSFHWYVDILFVKVSAIMGTTSKKSSRTPKRFDSICCYTNRLNGLQIYRNVQGYPSLRYLISTGYFWQSNAVSRGLDRTFCNLRSFHCLTTWVL